MSEHDSNLPQAAVGATRMRGKSLDELDNSLAELDKQIADAHAASDLSRLIIEVPGIGKLIATAIVSHVTDPNAFRSGRDFAAWLELMPRQNSSGGKQSLGPITKQGNRYIRKLLVLGATSLLSVAGKRVGSLPNWIMGLLARNPARLVTVALANKLARIIWAMMKTGESFRPTAFAKGQKSSFAGGSLIGETHRNKVQVWQARNDMMNDNVCTEDLEKARPVI